MKTSALNKTLSLMLLSMLSVNLSAQSVEAPVNKRELNGGFGYFNSGGQNINISGLNQFLRDEGYSHINPNQLTLGGGGGFVIKNFFLGGEGGGFMNNTTSNNLNNIAFTGGYGFFNLGYVISTGKRSALLPVLGAGGGGYSMMIHQKNTANNNFKDQLTSPDGSSQLDAGGFIFQAQVSWKYFFCGKNKEGFFLGLKSGYRYSPGSWTLERNGSALENSPGINMNGIFAGIILGGGSLSN